MHKIFKSLTEKYYEFWLSFINLKNKTKILPIDFRDKWTKIVFYQKYYLVIVLAISMCVNIFNTLFAMIIGWVIEQADIFYFFVFLISWAISILLEFIAFYYASILEIQCTNSIQYNAFRFFLTVDPVFHTKKESGKIFAKISRAGRAYEDLFDIIFYDLAPTIINITTVVISFFFISYKLGMSAFLLLLLISLINILMVLFYAIAFENNLIKADDKVKVISVESLNQVQLIRAYFASNSIAQKAKHAIHSLMYKVGSSWLAIAAIISFTRMLYLASIGFLGVYILKSIKLGILSKTIGLTLMITYLRGTSEVIRIGRRIGKLSKAIIQIKDLFSFINNFGQQTYPVLTSEFFPKTDIKSELDQAKSLSTIKLEVKNLHFDYNNKVTIFENHNLFLEVDKNQKDKLYGIIGPSGMGKTTLISILGGQLKPVASTITVNGISIYDIDDQARQNLIAIQGQAASGLSGTLKKNLILGLPEEVYTDDYIIHILKEVGIWSIFEEKEGLITQVGEGGLTLSGGQRQRLNFASLYLRAQYYKPLLILIDEPTSSLDEVSELAITNMINKLAQESLTLVIAHRLKTLKDAVGILDFSLIYEKDIRFYQISELKEKSSYFRNLLNEPVDLVK
ncbi:ATP-binding cassette domain-containing protein [Candidatus Babela massiliensis]|uniref:Multidrug resistance ABC transporter ATP-binding and permease domain n=1 Tax=Candidatus Babela massiliensis TaxID=673862 RepID=V6DHL1_9BACT|nr:ABC transporter ATP-binding protein [Candidatus Babela massiliensis]CDK31082.1 Multidrug resistance ABC transporter ATP-binding and permease domain [Candidatus Babela massiliensis]